MNSSHINIILTAACIAASALAVTACSDGFFDRYPSDSMQMETYLTNDSEAENILLDAYYYLRTVQEDVIMVNGLCTDEAYDYKKNNQADYISLNEGTWDATSATIDAIWANCYSMINRCNSVLDKIGNVSEKNRKQYEGEACMLRAYAYFTLVRLFGPVPLTEHVVDDYSDLYNYGRSPEKEVYALIGSDLDKAAACLPPHYSEAGKAGRATSTAAKVMMADTHMTLGDFGAARKVLEEVIGYAKANPASLGLLDDYASVFDSQNPVNKEIIFVAQFNNGATVVANYLMKRCIPAVSPNDQPAYTLPDGTASTILTTQGVGCLLMTWDLYNRLRSNPTDKRYSQMVYDRLYDASQGTSRQTEEVDVNDNGDAFTPATLKYFDMHNQGLKTCASGCDDIIYRYADVLLMYAECLNETNATAEAKEYLDAVRHRAGLAGTQVTSQSEMRLAIEDERLLELCFEGHRWYDLNRTGRINKVMTAHFNHRVKGLSAPLQANNNGMAVADCNDASGRPLEWRWNDSDGRILFPIPYSQLQLSGGWKQNPGY